MVTPAGSGSEPAGAGRTGGRWKGVAQVVVVLAAGAAAIYFARAPAGTRAAGGEPAAAPASSRPAVDVIHPAVTSAAREVRATGVVTAAAGVGLRSRVSGEVVAVSPALRSGGSFTAGQPLVWIDPTDYEIRLEAAQAQLRHAQARLAVQELRGEARSLRFLRENPDSEAPPLVARAPQIAREQARVDRALTGVRRAEIDLRRTTLSLPFDGWVTGSDVAVGQVVGPAVALAQVFAKDAIEMEARVSQEDLDSLQPITGRAAAVRAGGRAFAAAVQRVSAVVDPQSRQVTLYLAFAEEVALPDLPRPGAFASVTLSGPPLDGVMVLPEAAEQFGGSVWVVEDGALQSFQPRSLGRTGDGWLVEAFDPGQGVVIGRVAEARTGLPVTPVTDRGP